MISRITLVIIVLALVLAPPALAAGDGEGKIEGVLVNGTSGGSGVAGQELTLKIYVNDTEAGSLTARANAEGRFEFGGLDTGPAYAYQVTLTYQEADYRSPLLRFDTGEVVITSGITVYDATTDVGVVSVAMSHLIVYLEPGFLLVKEYLVFVNETDRTFIGSETAAADGKRETLRFLLPRGAAELTPYLGLMDCCIIGAESGFSDTMPLLPGAREVAYSYRVGYDASGYDLRHGVSYPTASFNLLVSGQETLVSGEGLTEGEPLNIDDSWYQHFTRQELAPGDTVVARLAGSPTMAAGEGPVGWLVLVLALGAGGAAYLAWRQRKATAVSPESSQELERENLLLELAQLDDDFESGTITEGVYRKLRAEKKQRLVALLQGLKE